MSLTSQLSLNVRMTLTALCLCIGNGHAQQEIIGHIMDEKGQPLPSATIRPRHYSAGATASDPNGNFRAWVRYTDTLEGTYVGFEPELVPVQNNLTVLVQMRRAKPQEDVAVVAGSVYISEGPLPPHPRYLPPPPPPKEGETNYDQIFTRVELPAQFPGGEGAWQRYLQRAFISDSLRLTSDVQGSVRVRYTIDRDGRASGLEFLSSLTPATDSLVRAGLERMPAWEPARQNGRTVATTRTLTIHFSIDIRIPSDWHANMYPAVKPVLPKKKTRNKKAP